MGRLICALLENSKLVVCTTARSIVHAHHKVCMGMCEQSSAANAAGSRADMTLGVLPCNTLSLFALPPGGVKTLQKHTMLQSCRA